MVKKSSDPYKLLITAGLPYSNGPLHLGHMAGAYLPADCYAKYKRLKKHDVLFICGSDEHGIAIELSAKKAGISAQEQSEKYHQINQALFKSLSIQFDHYSRTRNPHHKETTQQFFKDLKENKHLTWQMTDQLFCPKENRFLADRYVEGTCPECGYESARGDECTRCGASYEATDLKDPKSKVSGEPLIIKQTEHCFLHFEHFKDDLIHFLKHKALKPNVENFVKKMAAGIRQRAITRDSKWGIQVPEKGKEDKVLYVWFDAPIGYISITQDWANQVKKDEDAWKEYWLAKDDVKYVQFIGKDNIPFHALFFPAMIMGQKTHYKQVDVIAANEFYHLEGKQFSKSSGWYLDLQEMLSEFSADAIRYMIASTAPETSDSEFSWKEFQSKVNTDLVGKMGNFAHRVLTFIEDKVGEVIESPEPLDDIDTEFLSDLEKVVEQIDSAYENNSIRQACQHIMKLCQLGNVYFDAKKPWKLMKEDTCKEELMTTLGLCLYALKLLALLSYPIMPTTAEKLWAMLGYEDHIKDQDIVSEVSLLELSDRHIPKPSVLFHKIEDDIILQKQQNLYSLKEQIEQPSTEPHLGIITFEDFSKVELRAGRIESAEKIKKSHKLLKLQVNFGDHARQIVAGIAKGYPNAEDLLGKMVVAVVNLKPAKLCGEISEGMLLASGEGAHTNLVECPQASLGDRIG